MADGVVDFKALGEKYKVEKPAAVVETVTTEVGTETLVAEVPPVAPPKKAEKAASKPKEVVPPVKEKPAAEVKVEPVIESVEDDSDFELTPQEQAVRDSILGVQTPTETSKEVVPGETKPASTEKSASLDEKTQVILKNYEAITTNPLFEPLLSFVQSGGTNISDFVKQLNIQDPAKMDLVDFIRIEAESLGMTGERLDSAVAQELEAFEGMTDLQKTKKLKEFQSNFEKNQTESLKKFTVKQSDEHNRVEELSRTSRTKLDNKIKQLVQDSATYKESGGKTGKLYSDFLLIDDAMAQEISKLSGPLSMQINDDSGNLISHDIDLGVEAAINHLYGSKIKANIFEAGKSIGRKEELRKRHRPAENASSSSAAPESTDKLKSNIQEYKKQTGAGF